MEWITCENTYEESWRRLMEYANIELAIDAIDAIERKKGTPKSSRDKADYKNRAVEARASLLQAKEYFEAAKTSSLYTQPNHLYYGIVALSTACMLIRGGREKTLSYLRADSINKHHGLKFKYNSSQKRSKEGTHLLDNSFVEIFPNGHFKNWYETLIGYQPITAIVQKKNNNSTMKSLKTIGEIKTADHDSLIGKKYSITLKTQALPDLYSDLGRYGISLDYVRGEHIILENENKNNEDIHLFNFHQSSSKEAFLEIIGLFKSEKDNKINKIIDEDSRNGYITINLKPFSGFELPDSRATMDQETIYYKVY